MKTLYFCNLIPDKLGAYEALLTALGRTYRAAGDELVLVLARDPVAEVAAAFRAVGLRWVLIEAWSSGAGREHAWAFCLPAVRLVRRECPDVAVINFGNELPALAASLLARLVCAHRTRWVWVQHQQIQPPSAVARHVSRIRLLGFGLDHLVAVYAGGRASLLERGLPPGKLSVLDNAIADHVPQRARGWLARELGLPEGTRFVVTTGWLIPRKRIDFALRAFAGAAVPGAVLLVIGEGPERASLERLTAELNVADRVRFLGRRNDVRDILAESALLVHTSRAETCTYAITEAMAASIPAVVTDAGAAREQIADGASGFVLAPDDGAGLAVRIADLLGDAGRRQRFGEAARARFLARYRLEDSARRYHAMYRALACGDAVPHAQSSVPRVCHVTISLDCGGLERLVVDWTNARNARHAGTTAIACLDAAGQLAPDVRGDVIELGAQRGRFPWDAAAVRRLRLALLAPREGAPYTVVHSHNLAAQQYAALAVRGTALRHVHTEHGSNVHVSGLKNRLRQRLLARATDTLVAVSADTAARVAPSWAVPRERIRIVTNGIAPRPAPEATAIAALRTGLGLAPTARVIGAVGRLASVKGYDRLLAVFPAVRERVPEAVLVLVGDGPERSALNAQAHALGIASHVRFTGFRADARDLLAVFDVWVAPSRSEGLPVALLEAMAVGCPVLVTDVGEQRAVIDDGRAGTLLAADPAAWPAQIAACLAHESRDEALARADAAQRRVTTAYGLDATVAAYEALYREAQGKRP